MTMNYARIRILAKSLIGEMISSGPYDDKRIIELIDSLQDAKEEK